jgi:hypothetical protein
MGLTNPTDPIATWKAQMTALWPHFVIAVDENSSFRWHPGHDFNHFWRH